MENFDHFHVVVCGGGHAGCEAALAAARVGAKTLLLTGNIDTIAKMSCNPAIGGLAKGNIVREIDALGGEMAINTDATAIQFRLLNRSRGPAVHGPRAQCDKDMYCARMKRIVSETPNLTVFQAIASGIIVKDCKAVGVSTNIGIEIFAATVVLTSGTFLRGLIHVGNSKIHGGRLGDFSEQNLSSDLMAHGIQLDRMKTGTPPRILGSSIDFSGCGEQRGDENPYLFAFYDTRENGVFRSMFGTPFSGDIKNCALLDADFSNQKACWITHTTAETKEIILGNMARSPLYSGEIKGLGPRYCPSIEDKYAKFPDHETHMLFLEPEGYNSDEWYVNGLSSSMPIDVQLAALRSIPALKNARMTRPAYAIEYDFAPPTQIDATLQSKVVENIFFAGQINGTSGYEEAAGQGLVAGVNAARKASGKEMMTLGRHDAYIGVLIDDLVTKGTFEPYRMFTSRAEYRLLLNHGSADVRLLNFAEKFELLGRERISKTRAKLEKIKSWLVRLGSEKFEGKFIADWLVQAREEDTISFPDDFYRETSALQDEVIYRIRYAGYLEREQRLIEKTSQLEHVKIPENFDYAEVRSLGSESRQKLQLSRPQTLGQASRISGVTPVDISLILVALEKSRRTSPEAR
ncbi:MAG: tRNA uridine-5-carboxymethylaminomethyl(34) synthesis enzyme MnmG [Puniceicoccales bacterium]|jgi:tRNA uridine 5-carboxymethylaminomethyl modification enzyme|nr:tRNA uridine-5-carboxymethylaminomethyl(34) synthesis enzyme MnmG [Puniceicoccales bacterium]